MHDPKFENEVQKKLEELSFSPSEAVWTRVERAVNEKRRRRLPFFWFFLLPSLGLAGAGMIYFSKHHAAPTAQVVQHTAAPAPVSGPASSTSAPVPPVITKASPARTVPRDQDMTSSSVPVGHRDVSSKDVVSQGMTHQDLIHQDVRHRDATHQDMTHQDAPIGNGPLRDAPTRNAPPQEVTVTHQDIASPATPSAASPGTQSTASPRTLSHSGLPDRKSFDRQFGAPTASRLAGTSTSAAAKTPINLKPKYTWEMGFAGGIGASSMNSSLFRQPTVAAINAPALSTPMAVTATSKTPVSGVQPDISYWAGIVAQRPLSRALTLSLGLDLHYYSTRQQIGDAVYNNPVSFYQASTLFNYQQPPSNAQSSGVYPYYSVGSTDVFVNRYYFLELPVSVLWKVNHSRNLPLFWENGLSLSYLVSTNSLYYNAKSGVFYKDQGAMANKTQLNLSTALLVGLPIKTMRLQVGPQVQYGLTSLQHQSSVGQHLFYGGIRIVLLPGKAKK